MKRNKKTILTQKIRLLILKLKKKSKKVTTIEVDENIETENILNNLNEQNKVDNIIEVKDKIFNIASHGISEKILYENRTFIKDRHQTNNYPFTINYRCKNQRKNEHILGANFCNALIKRKQDKEKCYYIKDKEHCKECIESSKITHLNNINIIGKYNEFINECINYLDSIEDYNKKLLTMKLQEIYNNKNIILN